MLEAKHLIFAFLMVAASKAAAQDWDGAYIGLSGSYANGDASLDQDPLLFGAVVVNPATTTDDFGVDGGLVGLNLGYNWQNGKMVYGFEVGYSVGEISGSDGNVGPTLNCAALCEVEINDVFTLRGKLGTEVADGLLL